MAKKHLSEKGMLQTMSRVKAPKATPEDALLVHSAYLVDTVGLMSDLGSGELGEGAYASPDLLETALIAVGGSMKAAEIVVSEEAKHAFALMRPPGHHASVSTPMGLCYFNNVAVAVKHIMKRHGIKRVSILDFDAHHGNGTSEIFYTHPGVQYISLHEYDYENFGLGHYEEIGYGKGKGTNINIPLLEASPDVSYKTAIERVVRPVLESFKPEVIAVSAGYDPHYADPVGNMNVDSSTFWEFGHAVKEVVDALGAKGSFWILEGGYNPLILGPCIETSLQGLQGKRKEKLDDQVIREVEDELVDANNQVFDKVLETLAPFM